jgi:hypothetical protein
MKNRIKSIVFFGIVISLISCKTRQSVVVAESVPPPETQTKAEPPVSVNAKRLNYTWISYRANVTVSNSSPDNVNAFVVNRRDSIIYINVSKFGIEGARLVLTPDSVKFINHLASNYYVGNYALLEQWTGFKTDFYMLQSLLVGEELPEISQSLIQVNYGNFTVIDSLPFFQQADFVIPKEKIQINIQVKSIKVNEPGPTSIRIPEKYKPMY